MLAGQRAAAPSADDSVYGLMTNPSPVARWLSVTASGHLEAELHHSRRYNHPSLGAQHPSLGALHPPLALSSLGHVILLKVKI